MLLSFLEGLFAVELLCCLSDIDVCLNQVFKCLVFFLEVSTHAELVSNHSAHHPICIYLVAINSFLQFLFPGLGEWLRSITQLLPSFIQTGDRPFESRLLLDWTLLLPLFYNLIHLEIILLLRYFFPLRYFNGIVLILVNLLLTNLLQIVPFLLLLFSHQVTFWRLIVFQLCQIIHKTRIPGLFTNVYPPHLELLILRSLIRFSLI